MKPLLECRNITVAYPIADGILRLYGEGVSFTLEEGGFLSVVGGSGWGKSTLINIVLGLEKPTRGTVQLEGENMTQRDIADAAGVTEVTIRNRYKGLRLALGI